MAEEGGCAVLYYSDTRGKAEVIRLMLAAAGITVNVLFDDATDCIQCYDANIVI